mgnify:CR=1 FL=1
MKRDARGFIVFENKKEEAEWMRVWMLEHPGCWVQCPTCRSWHLSKTKPRPGSQCAQCRGQGKVEEGQLMPNRKPGFPTQHVRGSRDRRDWADYH